MALATFAFTCGFFVRLFDVHVNNKPDAFGYHAVCTFKCFMRTSEQTCMKIHKLTKLPDRDTNVAYCMPLFDFRFGSLVITTNFEGCGFEILNFEFFQRARSAFRLTIQDPSIGNT